MGTTTWNLQVHKESECKYLINKSHRKFTSLERKFIVNSVTNGNGISSQERDTTVNTLIEIFKIGKKLITIN